LLLLLLLVPKNFITTKFFLAVGFHSDLTYMLIVRELCSLVCVYMCDRHLRGLQASLQALWSSQV